LMHCTVKPGRYCIFLPQWPLRSDRFRGDDTAASKIDQAPWRPVCSPGCAQNKSVA
jgi:hypothetical protein